jgi:DNA-binding NtrC family response regulator
MRQNATIQEIHMTGSPAPQRPAPDRPRVSESKGFEVPPAILVVDGEPGMRNFLQRALSPRCALLEVAESVEAAEALRRRYHFDLLILDIRLPGLSGVEWLQQLRDQGTLTDVIFMTAYADLDTAIAALRAGAADFILKPFRLEQMLASVERCLVKRKLAVDNFLLRRQARNQLPPEGMVGQGAAISEVYEIIQRVAPTATTILIQGETGTGKELVARAIHRMSERSGAFVPVNCGSISPELLESELFGHVKGAYTGAHSAREGLFSYAHEGTLFLDEIGEMPSAMQAKLLRVLEQNVVRPVGSDRELPVSARVIAATNRQLFSDVEQGRFRRDLFYRLNVLTINVPALRDRREDIPELAQHFSHTLAAATGAPAVPFAHQEIVRLQQYPWPGNVRELKNVIERSLLLGRLPSDCCREGAEGLACGPAQQDAGYPLNWRLEEVEKQHILRVLEAAEGNKSEAARRLGVSRKTLERKLALWQQEAGADAPSP